MDWQRESKVPALQRSIAILEYLAQQGSSQGSALVAYLNAPKSSVYLLLDELKHHRLVAQDKDGYYRLGIRLIELGEQASGQFDLREVARPHLHALMEQTGLLCHLGIIDGESAYYVLKIESTATIRVHSWEGKRLSLHSSGLGKCMLAWTGDALQQALINQIDFEISTPNTIASAEKLIEDLKVTRERGWSYDDQEALKNVRCVAAPVFDATGGITAAISVVGTTLQIAGNVLPDLSAKVKRTASLISRELGYREVK